MNDVVDQKLIPWAGQLFPERVIFPACAANAHPSRRPQDCDGAARLSGIWDKLNGAQALMLREFRAGRQSWHRGAPATQMRH
jgi:hypothetical protein